MELGIHWHLRPFYQYQWVEWSEFRAMNFVGEPIGSEEDNSFNAHRIGLNLLAQIHSGFFFLLGLAVQQTAEVETGDAQTSLPYTFGIRWELPSTFYIELTGSQFNHTFRENEIDGDFFGDVEVRKVDNEYTVSDYVLKMGYPVW